MIDNFNDISFATDSGGIASPFHAHHGLNTTVKPYFLVGLTFHKTSQVKDRPSQTLSTSMCKVACGE